MSAMDKLRQWLKEESKQEDIDVKNLSLAQKLLEPKLMSESSDPFMALLHAFGLCEILLKR